jgi:ATP-binding cassette subfamily B protein
VREVGTHQELVQKRGIYYKLYELQYKDQEASAARNALSAVGPAKGAPAGPDAAVLTTDV